MHGLVELLSIGLSYRSSGMGTPQAAQHVGVLSNPLPSRMGGYSLTRAESRILELNGSWQPPLRTLSANRNVRARTDWSQTSYTKKRIFYFCNLTSILLYFFVSFFWSFKHSQPLCHSHLILPCMHMCIYMCVCVSIYTSLLYFCTQ